MKTRQVMSVLILLGIISQGCASSTKPSAISSARLNTMEYANPAWKGITLKEAPIEMKVLSEMKQKKRQWVPPHGGEIWKSKNIQRVVTYGQWGDSSFNGKWQYVPEITEINGIQVKALEYKGADGYAFLVILNTVSRVGAEANKTLIEISSKNESFAPTVKQIISSIKVVRNAA